MPADAGMDRERLETRCWRQLAAQAIEVGGANALLIVETGKPIQQQRRVVFRGPDVPAERVVFPARLMLARAAGIASQIGTMVESSIASAAGLHFAAARGNVQTVEMGGPLMLAEDIGNARNWYDSRTIAVPDLPGLGFEIDDARVRRLAVELIAICA